MNYHLYADDTQIYMFGNEEDIPNLIDTTSKCIREIKIWMDSNKLKLNEDKSEVMLIANTAIVKSLPRISVNLNGLEIEPSSKIKNLGVVFDDDLSMSSHISSLCKNLYFQMREISRLHHAMPNIT